MTTGATLYLVSACSSAEEFVAAFRRYADRTGLFVPSSTPLPAGRKGRLALTLKDGGVMIMGEAEVIQSSTKATVLHGRPGMTLRFVEPDELSKVVIGELEKARLAMKPAPLSVPPRPADVPAEPRPVPPALGGRIDAANALAESVVIGDVEALVDTQAAPPKVVADPGSGKAAFVVPSIPGAGAPRSHTPSTPPPRAHTPSTPPPSEPRPRTPSVPPDPTSKPLPKPAKLTSIGFPVVDRAPAFPSKAPAPGAAATMTVRAPTGDDDVTAVGNVPTGPKKTDPMPTAAPSPSALMKAVDDTTAVGEVPSPPKTDPMPVAMPSRSALMTATEDTTEVGAAPAPRKTVAAVSPGAHTVEKPAEDTTAVGAAPAPTPAKKGAAPASEDSTEVGAAPAPTKPAPKPSTPPATPANKPARPTSIGVPVAQRTVLETQPVGVVRPPVVPGESGAAQRPAQPASPRGKSATKPPLTPRHPTPVAPVPIVRAPAKAAPVVEVEEERTDLTETPEPPPSATPLAYAETVESGRAYAVPPNQPQRSGGMRASEILAAVPTDDWTMTPDASSPTVLPTAAKPAEASAEAAAQTPLSIESKIPPKGPPTGNWSISLDPDTGWSEPVKLETPKTAEPPPPKAPKVRPKQASSGNPVIAVSSDKAIVVQQWEDKPTGIGEAKIEIDSTLMEPLTPMPADEPADGSAAGSSRMPSAGGTGSSPAITTPASPNATGPQLSLGVEPPPSPFATPRAPALPPPAPPVPPAQGLFANVPPAPPPGAQRPGASLQMAGFATAPVAEKPKRRRAVIVVASIAALAAGFALVLVLTGGSSKGKANAKIVTPSSGSGSAVQHAVVAPPVDAAVTAVAPPPETNGSGSAAVEPDTQETKPPVPDTPPETTPDTKPAEPPPTGGTCKVAVSSSPSGAGIFAAEQQVGTTPATLDLPCGVEIKLSVRKSGYVSIGKTVTPTADQETKVGLKLGRPTYTVKVTSSPPGATITVNGKSMGVTPAQIRLPAFEPSPVMLSKSGFQTDTDTLTPKTNNLSHHVVLKKKSKR